MSLLWRFFRLPLFAQGILACLALMVALLIAFGPSSAVPFAIVGTLALIGVVGTVNKLQSLMIVVTTAAFALCVLECVAIYIEPHFTGDRDSGIGPRLTIGWGPTRSGRFHVTRIVARNIQYDATYTIDDRLLRKVDAGSSGKGVTFLGDSFVFGTGLDDKETLPQLFADDTGRAFPVFNLGVPGYSPANVLAELQSGWADDLLAKTRLNVMFVAPWHAERLSCGSVLSSMGPRYELKDARLVFAAVCPAADSLWSTFAIYRVFVAPHLRSVSDRDIDLLVAVTAEDIRLSLEKYKVPIVIYYLRDAPYLHRLSWTDDRIIASFRAAGAQVLDYTLENGNDPKYRIRGDGHPTALANALRAERLAAFVRGLYPDFEEAPARMSDKARQ